MEKKIGFEDLDIVERDSLEWVFMWDKLANHKINKNLKNPYTADNFGEHWMYMYTENGFHVFKHRLHSGTEYPKRLDIPASTQ